MSEVGAPRRSARKAAKPVASPASASASASAPALTKTATLKRKSGVADADGVAKADGKKSKPSDSSKAAAAAGGVLKVGDKLPSLKLKLQDGREIDTADLKKVVIFSYPRANTSGCTTQAKLFRDQHSSFTASSYAVYGLSNDSPTSLASWKAKQSFPYDLISDPNRKLIHALTGSNDKTRRSHFVIDQDGRLALTQLSVKPVDSCPAALKFIENK